MKEDKINNTTHQQTEKKTKKSIGKPRKYSSEEEGIIVNSEKQCPEKRTHTEFKKQLREEGRFAQSELIDLLGKNAYEKEYIDWLIKKKNPKHEEK